MGERLVSRPTAGPALTTEELADAFQALSAGEKAKLAAIEAFRRQGTEFGPGELIQEALYRVIAEKRLCPRDISVMAFLAMTMKSIAHHARKRYVQERPPDDEALVETLDSAARSPEEELMEKQDAAILAGIISSFSDDEEAQLVLMGTQDGLKGTALREATGLAQGQIDYAFRRIRLKIRKSYPQGWRT